MIAPLEKLMCKLRARYQGSALPRFFRWWWSELQPLIPPGLMRWFTVPGEKLLITASDDAWLLWRVAGGQVSRLDRLDRQTDPAQSRDRLQACMDHFQETLTGVIFCLPAEYMLCKRLRLPLAAEANLQQAVGFELDRQTPFKPEDVYFDVKVVHREPPFIDVELYITPRQPVDQAVEQLARLGLGVQGIDIDRAGMEGASGGSPGQADPAAPPRPTNVNLLPRAKRTRRVNQRVRLNWGLGAAAAALLALVMAESLYLRQATIDQLQQRRDQLRSEAMEVTRLRKQLEETIEAANFLARQQAQSPDLLDVLAEVTGRLPAHTWIQRLQMRGTELEVLGLSDNSQQMVDLLNESPLLDNTSFKGTISNDRRLNKERFTLTASIDPAVAWSPPEPAGPADAVAAAGGAAGLEGGR